MVAGGDPRRVGRIEEYLRAQGVLPRRCVVVVVVGEHHVDGGPCSGGRRLGWSWFSSGRAAEVKLKPGLGHLVPEETTDKVRAARVASPEWIELVAEADRGGRSWGRRPPRGPPSGLAGYWWGAVVVRARERARDSIL